MARDLSTQFRFRTGLRLLGALGLTGCATAPRIGQGPAGGTAHVTVVNLSDYRWRIEITPAGGATRVTEIIDPRRSADVDVPGGSYRIDQSIDNPGDRPPAARHFTAALIAGQKYRWPLATLQSESDEEDLPASRPGG